jgi:tRNA A-37 threonylcarbamoyl transferase component Bud32
MEGELTAPSAADLTPLFPGLEITAVAGAGGMGTVYKARQPQLDRVVALKILSRELGRDPAFAKRFSREAQALAKLNHSNIVSVFDFGQVGGLYYVLMEYVDGMSLRSLIDQNTLPAEEAQRLMIEICHALQYAHEEGIVHRDIKPSNILLDKKGRVKIADVGPAGLMIKEPKDPAGGHSGLLFMGTPLYMAPEQLKTPWKVDRRTDIYSVGVVAYEMLTGEPPTGEFGPPSQKTGGDPSLDKVVMRALSKDPRKRFQNANDLRAAVEGATGRFHNLPGDRLRGAGGRKWAWLPRFAMVAGTIWLSIVTYLLFRERWTEQKTVQLPATALEAFGANPDGVGIGRRMATDLHLDQEQVISVNRVLRRNQREFMVLERRNTERSTNAAGHVIVTIMPFPQEMDALTNRMWTNLSAVLNAAQLTTAKTLDFGKFFPHAGQKQMNVEIWQGDDGELHYVENQEPAIKNSGAGGFLTQRYRNWFFHNSQKTNTAN